MAAKVERIFKSSQGFALIYEQFSFASQTNFRSKSEEMTKVKRTFKSSQGFALIYEQFSFASQTNFRSKSEEMTDF